MRPPTSPSARTGPSLAADPASEKVVLFGGSTHFGTTYLAETWTWDGASWTEQHPPTSPPAREGAMIATDPHSGHVVLFGGFGPLGNGFNGYLGDTWTWDGATWTAHAVPFGPPPRETGTMAADPTSGRVVLFGGFDGSAMLADTWTWDGTTWTKQHPSASPPARAVGVMATDASRRVVLFGGIGGVALGDTWTWDGANWTQPHPPASPPARGGAAIATDPLTGRVVLFGGFDRSDTDLGDTWTWDGTTWTEEHPVPSPAARSSPNMATDPEGRAVLFGGFDRRDNFDDTWSLTPSLSISPRRGAPGALVTVRGLGYTSGASVVVEYHTSPRARSVICSTRVGTPASATGFSCSARIPTEPAAGRTGPHIVTATDSTGLQSATIFTLSRRKRAPLP